MPLGAGSTSSQSKHFSDYPLPLSVAILPPTDVGLIEGVDELPLSQEARAFLGSLRVNTATPILFLDFDSGVTLFNDYQRQLLTIRTRSR
ncbi:hypothetical protein [Paraburkholderia caribensis]|uniref:hypothetical protein n=1 Tax=Paraburkholderia caribensis TaxID=75105 RepID=UPI001D06B3BA|nr:hypothetical protein [Paraburkholderia caribensis]